MSFLKTNQVDKMTTAQRNKWYQGLSKEQKAVAIAEDILVQLDTEKYIAHNGTYGRLSIKEDEILTPKARKARKLDSIINAPEVQCNVCAMGSAFMSAVRLGNKCTLKQMGYDESFQDEYDQLTFSSASQETKLREAFTKRQYRAMEFMFEGSDIGQLFTDREHPGYADENEFMEEVFEAEYEDLGADERLRKICQNIIDHQGVFTIPGIDLR